MGWLFLVSLKPSFWLNTRSTQQQGKLLLDLWFLETPALRNLRTWKLQRKQTPTLPEHQGLKGLGKNWGEVSNKLGPRAADTSATCWGREAASTAMAIMSFCSVSSFLRLKRNRPLWLTQPRKGVLLALFGPIQPGSEEESRASLRLAGS